MENNFLEAMNFRHACKEFDNTKQIKEDDFNSILEYGRMSPSSFGFEPWKFVVIQNEELRNKLKEFSWGAQGQLPTASHFVLILSRKIKGMKYDSAYISDMLDYKQLPDDVKAMYKGFYEKFQKEDFDLLADDKYLDDWASKQTYLALANMMTGAATMGIDSCPIEGFDIKLTNQFLKDELKIDTDEFGISVMAAFGYRKDEPRGKSRQIMEDVVSWYN